MKKILTFVLLVASGVAWCQVNGRYDNIAIGSSSTGLLVPIPGALVSVCTQPASTFTFPCSPKASLCASRTDVICTQPNPVQADPLGNFFFYALPGGGPYTLMITGPSVTTPRVLVDQNVNTALTTTLALKTNGTSNGSQTILNMVSGAGITVTQDGAGNETFATVAPASAASPGFLLPNNFYWTQGTGSSIVGIANGFSTNGTQASGPLATATEPTGRLLTSTAVASTQNATAVAVGLGANPGQGQVTPGLLLRGSTRIMTQAVTALRYWVGLFDSSGGTIGGATYVSDTPNANYCMFRHSDTTDTNWKAVCATSNVAQTVVDTGVATSTTASYMFEIAFTPAFAPTTALFYLNGTQVASITTNLPSASLGLGYGYMVDNKNSATATSTLFQWIQVLFNK